MVVGMEESVLKDLEALHRFFIGYDIDDERTDFSGDTKFEAGLHNIQLAGKRALDEITSQFEVVRGRVKSSKSFLNKCAYLRTIDITTIQDIVAVTIVRENIDDCYEALREILSYGFVPYFKLLDTLRTPINNYGSLDMHLRNGTTSFEMQIRPPLFDESYQATHGRYKDKTTAIEIDSVVMNDVKAQLESLAEKDVVGMSIYDILVLASHTPLACYQWRTLKIDDMVRGILKSAGIVVAENQVIIPERRVFI